MNSALWQADLDGFRLLHGWSESPAVAALARVLSDSGLGHVQLAGILVVLAARRWPAWASALLAAGWLAACWTVERDWATLAACALAASLLSRFQTRALRDGLVAGVAAGALRLAVEPAFDRLRPSNLPDARPLESVFGASSFPSGHATTTAALVVAVLVSGCPRRWGWALAAWGALVAVSRVVVGVHFPSDILGGVGFGAAVAGLLAAALQSRTETAARS